MISVSTRKKHAGTQATDNGGKILAGQWSWQHGGASWRLLTVVLHQERDVLVAAMVALVHKPSVCLQWSEDELASLELPLFSERRKRENEYKHESLSRAHRRLSFW